MDIFPTRIYTPIQKLVMYEKHERMEMKGFGWRVSLSILVCMGWRWLAHGIARPMKAWKSIYM